MCVSSSKDVRVQLVCIHGVRQNAVCKQPREGGAFSRLACFSLCRHSQPPRKSCVQVTHDGGAGSLRRVGAGVVAGFVLVQV